MNLLNDETRESLKLELENFIEQKRLELEVISDPELKKRFEKSMNKMRIQMERLLEAMQYQENEEN